MFPPRSLCKEICESVTVITSSVDLAVHIVKSHFSKRLSTYPVLDWSSPVQSDKYLWRHIWEVFPKEWTTALLWFCEFKVFDIHGHMIQRGQPCLLIQHYLHPWPLTFPRKTGFSLRILVARERCNVTGAYFERGHIWIKNSHRLPNICRRILGS